MIDVASGILVVLLLSVVSNHQHAEAMNAKADHTSPHKSPA